MGSLRPLRIALAVVLTIGGVVMVLRALHAIGFTSGETWYSRRPFERSVDRAILHLENEIRNEAVLDSMLRNELRISRRDGPLTIMTSNGNDALVQRALDVARSELERMPGRTSAAPAMIMLEAVVPRYRHFWNTMLAGDSVCAIAIVSHRLQAAANNPGNHFPPLLGTCALYLAYGRPGAAARELLAAPRWDEPMTWQPFSARTDTRGRSVIATADRRYFERDDYVWLLRAARCSRGSGEACRHWMGQRWSSAMRADFAWWLIQQDAGRSFARFWRSNAPLEQAVRDEFGASYDELAGRYGQARLVLEGTGPTLPAQAAPTLALALIGGLVIALVVGRRRTLA